MFLIPQQPMQKGLLFSPFTLTANKLSNYQHLFVLTLSFWQKSSRVFIDIIELT